MSLDHQRESLRHLSKADLLDLALLHSKHKTLDRVLDSVAIIFNRSHTFSSYQSLFSDPALFEKIIALRPSDLSPTVLEKLKPIIEDPNLIDSSVKEVSEPGYHIFRWIKALYTASRNHEDLEEEMAKLDINVEEEEHEIPASIDDLEVESRNLRATELKTEYQLAQNLLDDVVSECYESGSISDIKNPSDKVVKLVKAMCVLLGEEATWENGCKIMHNCALFNEKTKSLDMDKIPLKRINTVRVMMQDPDLRMTNIENEAPSLSKILMWITTVMNYCLMSNYIESGEAALSESAEEEAIIQEAKMIETLSKLLDEDEGEKLTKEERARLKELEKVGSLEDL